MPWVRVWLHFVWSTKNREPFLNNEIRKKVFRHIKENAKEKDIHIDFIGGYVDHVHCLVSLGTDQTMEKIMQLIEGESSFWINKNSLTQGRFGWQDEYFVVSVSEANVVSARKYIANQDEHHKSRSFDEEFNGFMKRAGFQRFEG